eukprot:NODE_30433_length_418_cov_3.127148.p2 GENE.NODE_30433_length_418_cov_3.127148~~NODE_30433_length_418_cov_3.127148.p2  ORF type:complete len:102 (-),score=27.60 NODE_30433_length_418_cov_3.127148:112-417(-)
MVSVPMRRDPTCPGAASPSMRRCTGGAVAAPNKSRAWAGLQIARQSVAAPAKVAEEDVAVSAPPLATLQLYAECPAVLGNGLEATPANLAGASPLRFARKV